MVIGTLLVSIHFAVTEDGAFFIALVVKLIRS